MSNDLWSIFSIIGITSCVAIAGVLLYAVFNSLIEHVHELCWQYKYKHRFDAPPTAACYCKDCKWHSVKDNKCSNVTWADRHTPDNGFCYEAEPMTMKEAARRGKAD